MSSTAKASGGVSSIDAGQVNYWWTHRTPIEHVKWNAGNFYAIDNFMNATDAGQINGYFVHGVPVPAQGYWTFWKQPDVSSGNPPASVNTFTVAGADVVQNYYALCVGDFDRSYIPPAGGKSSAGSSSIQLAYDEPILAEPDKEISLPFRVTSAMKAGAIAMIMNFPPDLVSVEDVLLGNGTPSTALPVDFSVNGNELRIGWYDQIPIDLAASDCLLTLKLKTSANFTKGHSIMFTMAEDPLNQLADGQFEPIENVVLLTRVIEASTTGIGNQEPGYGLTLESYPNPFFNLTYIKYTLPFEGEVVLDVTNMYGSHVLRLVDATQPGGEYTVKLYGEYLNPGVYTVTLKTRAKGDMKLRSIKIVRGW